MKKRSVNILGHATSVTLEDEFWQELKHIARARGKSLSALIGDIDKSRENANLSSALRLYVLNHLKTHTTE